QAGQMNPDADVTTTLNQQVNGKPATKLAVVLRITQEIPVPPADAQSQPRTETVNITHEYNLFLDPTTSLPLQETLRVGDANDRELSFRTATYDSTQFLDRSAVASDVLSLQAVQGMQASIDQLIDRARRMSFPLFWLGRELARPFTDAKNQRQTGLVLNDVVVVNQPNIPNQVVFVYGTRDEPTVPYVVLIQQARATWDDLMRDRQGQLWFQMD